ncbi:hypothetical protein [Ovoidimarina sediminis]|uniref:hypothetical protein n=1 Tax=Ovoidimarina sediminis TaxID=3079856 RepID=UPI00292E3CA4|nr:hypothetical protein [Rhodophyticola sp. MJ-SS7]
MTAAILAATLAAGAVHGSSQPYAGEDQRAIASLSPQDIDDLLAGRGWGFAKPAELNGYPGPTHLLELAEDLELTEVQAEAIEAVRVRMETDAQALGAAFVSAEAALDAAFASGEIDAARLTALTEDAARIEAALRARHLAAHLEVKPLLTRHQIVTYNRLRGYGADEHGGGHGQH